MFATASILGRWRGLLAEPMKIVQARKETAILYEVDNIHRQVFT